MSESLELRGRDLTLAPGAQVYLPPNIAGFVGADHVAMALATGAWEGQSAAWWRWISAPTLR